MTWFSDLPVQRKLGYAMLLTSTVALVLACGVFLGVEYIGYRRSIIHTVGTLARISADNSTAAIAFGDKVGARQNLEALRAEPQVIAATLYDDDGRLVARYSSNLEETLPGNPAAAPGVRLEKGYIIAVQPVVEGSRRLGTLYVQATMEQVYERMRIFSLVVLGVLVASVGLAGLIASVLRRALARPILELANTAGAVSVRQDYSLRARQYGRDELGQLTTAFNAMLETTQAAVGGLRESEWAHRELVRALPTAAYMCDPHGLITIFNEAAVALWGRTPELGQEYWCGSYKIFRPDGTPLPLDQCPMAVALREGRAVRGEEIIIERPDGTRRNVLPHPEPIRDTNGNFVGIVNMLLDITEQKRASAAALQLAAIVESSDDAIVGKDLAGVITSWNRSAERLFGYTAAEMIGRSVLVLMAPEQQKEEPGILEQIRRGEPIEHYETQRLCRDGTTIDVSLTISPIKDNTGRIVGASKIARDITERKLAEQQTRFLGQLSQELTLLAEPAEIMRAAAQAIGHHLQVDRCYFSMITENATVVSVQEDWAREGFLPLRGTHRTADFGTPEMWRALAAGPFAVDNKSTHPLTRNLGAGYAPLRIEAHAAVPFVRNGEWVASLTVASERPRAWRTDELVLLENALGRVWPMVERARGRLELQESERRQRELMRSLPVACYTIDHAGRITFFNDAAVQLWGQAPAIGEIPWGRAIRMTDSKGVPFTPEQYPAVIALREKRPVREFEAFVVRPDGSRRWVVPQPDPIFDADGNCTGVVTVVMDVTEERTAHEQVQKVADHLSLAMSAGQLGDWTWDAATDVIMLSPRTSEIYGVPSTPGLTRSAMRNLLPEEDRGRARVALQTAIANRTDYNIEYRVNRPDGTQRWVAAKGRSFYAEDGRIQGMVGVAQDITERKLQVKALEELSNQIKTQAQLFDTTLSNITDLAYSFDLQGRWMYANKPLLDIWGRTLDQIVGKSCLELGYPPALAARLEAQVREVIATKHSVRGETPYAGADGKIEDHEYIFSPVFDAQGKVTAVAGTTRLITERKRAEETLRQSEAQLRLVTDNAPVFLVRTDREHRFTFVNRAYAERNGFTPAAMVGMKVPEAIGPAAYASFRPRMEEALAGQRVEFEIEVPYAKLGHRWVHVIYVPERDARGQITGLLGVINDIGARKAAENELKRARDEAVAASRAKDDFLAALSHELRTPLNPVLLLASDAAENPDLPPAIRADFELIRKNVDLEARLIDDLLDLTRITRGKLQLDQRPCDVRTVLEDALSNVRPDLMEKHLQLDVHFAATESLVFGDSVRLQQIFWNILKNSVKFTPEGGRISVEAHTASDRGRLVITIVDSGIGMTPEELDRAFLAFTQGDHANSGSNIHRFGGLGLGLAITRMLVELHNGTIEARSEGRDQGSTFVIEFPVYSENVATNGRNGRDLVPAIPGASTPPFRPTVSRPRKPGPASLRRVLLVEDHAPTRLTMQHLLKHRQFEVTTAESATKAYQLALAGKFDLVISDVGLPDRNGYELMAELRVLQPGLAGIALSGYGMEEDLVRSRTAGFAAHLVKPVTIEMLENAIAGLVSPSTEESTSHPPTRA